MPGSLFDQVDAQIGRQPAASLFDDIDAQMQRAESPGLSAAHIARQQADQHGDQYLLDTIKNIPHDAYDQGKGLIDLVRTLAGATGEVGASTGGRIREIFGAEPYYPEGTPNVDAVAGMVPAVIQHFAGYLDPNERALMVRDHPVGLALDVAALTGGARGAVNRGRVAVPAMVSAAKNPIVRSAAGIAADVATGGRASTLRTARELGRMVEELRKPATQTPTSEPRPQPVPSMVKPVQPTSPGPTMRTATGFATTMPNQPVPFVMHVPGDRSVVPESLPRATIEPPKPSTIEPLSSRSKGAVKMSANDLGVYNREINAGRKHDQAMDVVVKERAERAKANYGNARLDAAARRAMEREGR